MDILSISILILSFILGMIFHEILISVKKKDGRFVIMEDTDEYFVAITTKPTDLLKKSRLVLEINTGRREKR